MNYKKKLDTLTNTIKLLIKEMYEVSENLNDDNYICEGCKTQISHTLDLINRITCPFCYTKIKSE